MRSIVTIILLTLYGLALVRPALPLIEYFIKVEAYKAKCVNRANPEMHCNGQCILMQKLKAFNTEKTEPIAPSPVKVNFEDYPIAEIELSSTAKSSGHETRGLMQLFLAAHYTHSFITDIFHPPLQQV